MLTGLNFLRFRIMKKKITLPVFFLKNSGLSTWLQNGAFNTVSYWELAGSLKENHVKLIVEHKLLWFIVLWGLNVTGVRCSVMRDKNTETCLSFPLTRLLFINLLHHILCQGDVLTPYSRNICCVLHGFIFYQFNPTRPTSLDLCLFITAVTDVLLESPLIKKMVFSNTGEKVVEAPPPWRETSTISRKRFKRMRFV